MHLLPSAWRVSIRTLVAAPIAAAVACGCAPAHDGLAGVSVRWLRPAEVVPHGAAPGAKHRLLAMHADGSKEYALILANGDEVWSGLAAFATAEKVTAARFTAIGAAHDLEVGWFDSTRKQYKALALSDQAEVLSLMGDIGLNANGDPVVHAHVVFGRSDGGTFGGHLIHAVTSPTLEVFVTTFPERLGKKLDSGTDVQLFDLDPRPAAEPPPAGGLRLRVDQ